VDWLSHFIFPCCAHVVPYSLSVVLAIRMPVPGAPLRFVYSVAKDGCPDACNPPTICFFHVHTYLSHPPLGKLSKWPWLYPPSTQHFTRAAPLPNPSPRVLACGACIGTAQVGALLAAPWARGSEEALAPSCCAPHGHDQTYLSPQCRPATAAGGHFCPAATLNTTNGLQGSFSSLDH